MQTPCEQTLPASQGSAQSIGPPAPTPTVTESIEPPCPAEPPLPGDDAPDITTASAPHPATVKCALSNTPTRDHP